MNYLQEKKYRVLSALIALSFMACSTDREMPFPSKEELSEGTPFEVTVMTTCLPEVSKTRASEIENVKNLYLMVFDQTHRFIYKRRATLEAIVHKSEASTFLPKNEAIVEDDLLYKFKVKLLSSKHARYIHFIVGYDGWADIPEDYLLENSDEGELIPALINTSPSNEQSFVYWQSFKFNNLSEKSFSRTAFKLLRNKAKVSVDATSQSYNFELKGFAVHNAPDRGTIATFSPRDHIDPSDSEYGDVFYTFPSVVRKPTIPANMKLIKVGDVTSNKAPILLYEYNNSEKDRNSATSVIVYGKRRNAPRAGYYKVDLKEDIYKNLGGEEVFIGSKAMDILRNQHYFIAIRKVDTDGYASYEEAVNKPAGNNLYASVELKDFPVVSDGMRSLSVDKLDPIQFSPGLFESNIAFYGAGVSNPGSKDVNVFFKNQLVSSDSKRNVWNDDYISSATFDKQNGKLYVQVKKIPQNHDEVREFLVVGTPAADPTTHLQRKITLTLRQRYQFHAMIYKHNDSEGHYAPSSGDIGQRVDISFTVPGTIPESLYPFRILIDTEGKLSPYIHNASGINDEMKIVKVGKRSYYEYNVRYQNNGGLDRTQTIHFQRSVPNGIAEVRLISDFYEESNVSL